MNLLDPNPNKRDVTLLEDKKENESVNPDQGLIEAAKELIKAVQSNKPDRVVRCFKLMAKMCEEQSGEDSEEI